MWYLFCNNNNTCLQLYMYIEHYISTLAIIGRCWAKYRKGADQLYHWPNNWSVIHWQITTFYYNRFKLFYHLKTKFVSSFKSLFDSSGKQSIIFHQRSWLQFHVRMDRIYFFCSKAGQTIIFRHLCAGCVVDSLPWRERKKCIKWQLALIVLHV